MFTRSKNNPILKPNKKNPWESKKVYNPGVIFENGKYHLFYRAVGDDWISSIGYAVSKDGEKFKRFSKPVLFKENKKEKRGLEDPRIIKLNNYFYITYTVYDGLLVTLQYATSKNIKNWKKHGKMIPDWDLTKAKGFLIKEDPAQLNAQTNPIAKKKWCKAGGIFPERINNNDWMIFGDRNIWLAKSNNGSKWNPIWKPFIKPRIKFFDSHHVEMGPPPIKTEKGWLVLYHGIDKHIVYRLGFLILDLNDPTKILYRSRNPIFEPREPYELSGLVDILPGGFKAMEKMSKKELDNFIKQNEKKKRMPKVIFCNGAVLVGDTLRIYYGASDSVICTATAKLSDILKQIKQ